MFTHKYYILNEESVYFHILTPENDTEIAD